MKSGLGRAVWYPACGLAVSIAVLSFKFSGLLDRLEWISIDARFHYLATGDRPSGRLAIIAVDDNSINYLKYKVSPGILWKWPRDIYARITDYVNRCGADAFLVDFLFSDPDATLAGYEEGETDEILAAAYKDFGSVFQALRLHPDAIAFSLATDDNGLRDRFSWKGDVDRKNLPDYPVVEWPVLPLLYTARNVGVTNISPDGDGVVRRYRPFLASGGHVFPFLPVSLAAGLSAKETGSLDAPGLAALGNEPVWIKWYGPGGPGGVYPYYPAAEVFLSEMQAGKGEKPVIGCDAFRGRIVLLGSNSGALFDLKQTPVSEPGRLYPGVEIHATVLDNLIKGQLPEETSVLFSVLLVMAMTVAGLGSSLIASRMLWSFLAAFTVSAFHILGVGVSFGHNLLLDAVAPEMALWLSVVSALGLNYLFEGRERRKVRSALNQYVSPSVAARVVEQPELLCLGGLRRRISVLFSDIRDFTTLSESLEPEEIVGFLNQYFDRMTGIVLDEGGTLDKYVGDAIMAFTGAPEQARPDDALRLCRAALGMTEALRQLNRTWQDSGLASIRIGVGINTGEAVVGNMGSQKRFDYTAMGDTVNVASRLEGLNKEWGTQIIISETTRNDIADAAVCRKLDKITLKGRIEPVLAYELLGLKGDHEAEELARRYQEAERLASLGERERAMQVLVEIMESFPDDGPSLRRMEELKRMDPRD